MPTKPLSAKLIENLKPPETGQIEIFDTTLPGFGIRISKGGSKTWVLLYRINGRKRRMTIGRYPAMSLNDARTAAGKVIHAIQRGDDPALDKQVKRSTQPATFSLLSDEYIKRYAKPQKRSWKNDELFLRLHVLPEWKDRRPESIKRADVIALVEAAEIRGQPHLARQILAVVRKLFNWAVEVALVDVSPVAGVRLNSKLPDRSRVLSDPELKALWGAWDKLGHPWCVYFKVLLLTGQRRSELAGMKWAQIADRVWTLPPEENKSGRLHVLPLSPEVVTLLDSVPRTSSPYVFPSRARRSNSDEPSEQSNVVQMPNIGRSAPKGATKYTPISGFSAAVRKLNDSLKQPIEWRLHDLRRTAASGMAKLRFPLHVVATVLNHSRQATMKGSLSVYIRHDYMDEKREALEAWGRHVINVVSVQSEGEDEQRESA